jgi:hypothetical protein
MPTCRRRAASMLLCLAAFSGTVAAQERLATIPRLSVNAGNEHSSQIGWAVAGLGDLDGDGRAEFAVSANHLTVVTAGSGGSHHGRVEVYGAASTTPILSLVSPGTGARFGAALAAAGDLTGDGLSELAVGSRGGGFGGSVQVFDVASGSAVPLRTYASAYYDARFGSAIDGGRDVDGDGYPDLVVGAPEDGTLGALGGEVRLVSGAPAAGTLWSVLGAAGSRLGQAVAFLDDLDGDGKPEVLGCAPLFGGVATMQGRAYVYSGANGAVLYTLDGDSSFDEFGQSCARLGDLDGDGKAEFAVGSPRATPGPHWSAGRVFVYSGAAAAPLRTMDGPRANTRLGSSVADAGDLDLDGVSDIACGGTHDALAATEAGVVVVASGADGSTLFEVRGDALGGRLGKSVAGVGDYDGDGRPDLVVGAPRSGTIGAGDGEATVESFDRGLPDPRGVCRLVLNAGSVNRQAIAVGDVDGDGRDDVVATHSDFPPATRVVAYSGFTGRAVWTLGLAAAGVPPQLLRIGDATGDGVRDLLLYAAVGAAPAGIGWNLVSGADGSLLGTVGPTSASEFAAAIDDVDGDGVEDVVFPKFSDPSGSAVTWVYSGVGAPFAPLYVMTVPSSIGVTRGPARSVGDLDGDGVSDFILGKPLAVAPGVGNGQAHVHSGATGALIRSHAGPIYAAMPGGKFGFSVAGLGDVNGDGVPDYAVGNTWDHAVALYHGAVRAYSGATGAQLWFSAGATFTTPNGFGDGLLRLPDYDRDGASELLVHLFPNACPTCPFVAPHGLQILSGATGAVTANFPGQGFSFGGGDFNGDGLLEPFFLQNRFGDNRVHDVRTFAFGPSAAKYGRAKAADQSLDLGWRTGAYASAAGVLEIDGFAPASSGFLLAGPVVGALAFPGFAPEFYLDPFAAIVLPVAADAQGRFAMALDLTSPAATGLKFYVQAFAPTSPTTGAWSNGLAIAFAP